MALAICMGGSVLLENPATSWLFQCKWFLWLVRALKRQGHRVPELIHQCNSFSQHVLLIFLQSQCLQSAKMYRCTFWMKHWGAPTWKRTVLVGNVKHISVFDRGPLKRGTKCAFKTAEKYENRAGKVCYKGTRLLKQTGHHL